MKPRDTPHGGLTDWYPPTIEPLRVGVYQRDMQGSGNGEYSYWNGDFWGGWAATVDIAEKNKFDPSSVQDADWRGLARKP